MLTKSTMEIATRSANANTIFWSLDFPSVSAFIMKNKASPKLPMMATNAKMTKYFMPRIIS